jgi:hypothetical protein
MNPPSPLTHDEAFEMLDQLAFDTIAGAEREALLAHVESCPICQHELAQLRETVSMIGLAAPAAQAAHAANAQTRDRIRLRLMARASADVTPLPVPAPVTSSPSAPAVVSPPPPEWIRPTPFTPAEAVRAIKPSKAAVNAIAWRRAEWMAIAASMLLVASVAALTYVLRDRQNLRAALSEQIAREHRATTAGDSLRLALLSRDSIIAGLTGRDVAMMTLTSAGTKAPYGHMFWDRARNTWTLVAHNMPALKPGRTYQLWLVTPDRKISAGTFEPRDGDAMLRATYPLGERLTALAVTEEPEGGAPQPTGAMVMVANAH